MARPIDRTDVDRLVIDHLPSALRLATRLSGDSQAAEDVVQEALCRVLKRWRSFRGQSSFKTWFLAIVVNADRDRRRRSGATPAGQRKVVDAFSREGSPLDAAAVGELHQQLRTAIDRLPTRQRQVAALVWGEGLSAGEAARVLGATEANVYACIHLARKRLAQAVGFDFARQERS